MCVRTIQIKIVLVTTLIMLTSAVESTRGVQNYYHTLQNTPRKLIDVDMEGDDRLIKPKMRRMRKQKLIEFDGGHGRTDHIHRSLLQYEESDDLSDADAWEQVTDLEDRYRDADREEGTIEDGEDASYASDHLEEDEIDSLENSTDFDDSTDGDKGIFETVNMATPWGDSTPIPPIQTLGHGDMDIYDGFIRVPIDSDTEHEIVVRRRHLLQNQNSSTDNGDIIDLLGTTAANSVAPLIKIPRNESEVMTYVSVIFAIVSTLATIAGLCFHRRITYVTVNHQKIMEPIENKPPQPVTKSIPLNKLEQKPLLQTKEHPTEFSKELYLRVDSFL